ncbi:hypothetical protein HK097_001068, partial [Rhizophlyctis rosea]
MAPKYEYVDGVKYRINSPRHRAALRRVERQQRAIAVPTEAEIKKEEKRQRINKNARERYARKKAQKKEEELAAKKLRDELAAQMLQEELDQFADLEWDMREEDSVVRRIQALTENYIEDEEEKNPTTVSADGDITEDRWQRIRDAVDELDLEEGKVYHIGITLRVELGKHDLSGNLFSVGLHDDVTGEDYDFQTNIYGKDVLQSVINYAEHWRSGGASSFQIYDVKYCLIDIAESQGGKKQKQHLREQLQKKRKLTGSLKLFVEGVDQNETDDNTCGIQMIKNFTGLKKRSLIETIIGEFKRNYDDGISCMDVQKVCDRYKRTHVVVGIDGEVIYKQKKESGGNRKKTFKYYAIGDHFYPIVDESLRKSLQSEPDTLDICVKCGSEFPFVLGRDDCENCGGQIDCNKMLIDERKKVRKSRPLYKPRKPLVQKKRILYEDMTADELQKIHEGALEWEEPTQIVVTDPTRDLEHLIVSNGLLTLARNISASRVTILDEDKVQRRRIGVTKFKLSKTVEYLWNPHFETMVTASKSLNIPFTSQTPMKLMLEYYRYASGSATSSFNKWTEAWYPNNHFAIERVFHKSLRNVKEVDCYDLNRCYENAARKKKSPWTLIHAADFPEPYDDLRRENNPIGSLLPGVYVIEFGDMENQPEWFQKLFFVTKDTSKNRYYHHEYVNWLYNNGIDFTIHEQILAQKTVPAEFFNIMFDRFYETFGEALAKTTIREMIGYFNKRTQKQYEVAYSNSLVDLHHKYLCRGFVKEVHNETGEEKFYRATTYKEYEIDDNHIPIYQQIIEQYWIDFFTLARSFPTEDWVMCKTDEMVVRKGSLLDAEMSKNLSFKMPEVTEQKLNTMFNFSRRDFYDPLSSFIPISAERGFFEWKQLPPETWTTNESKFDESCLVMGRGGVGKSYGMKQMLQRLPEERVLKTASTHKSARLIGGETLHSALQYNNEMKYFSISSKTLKEKSHIIIDEALMLSRDVIRALVVLKRKNSHLKFILLGDPSQLPPVEHRIGNMAYDFSNNPLMMELCNYSLIKLTRNYRNSELTQIYDMLDEGQIAEIKEKVGKKSLEPQLHIIYDNYRRKLLGTYIANRERKRLKRPKNIVEGGGKKLMVFRDAKLYATITKKEFYTNQQQFTVKSFNGGEVILKTLKGTKNGYEITLSGEEVAKNFEYSYARTVYGVQGETLEVEYVIHRWDKLS